MKNTIAIVAVVIIVGGGAFYAGNNYGQARGSGGRQAAGVFANLSPEERRARFQQPAGTGNQKGMRGNEQFITGEVISKDDKSVTLKLRDGGSKIIFFTASTTIAKTADGSIHDVTTGEQIVANGPANQEGSINAQSIQIRPTLSSRPQAQ